MSDSPPLDVAVVIVSWNVRALLADCLASVQAELATSGLRGAVWVVDNGSTDGSPDLVSERFPSVNLIVNGGNVGFGAANNQAMRAAAEAGPTYFWLLNPDTVVRRGALRRLVDALVAHPKAGVAGPRLVYGDGRLQHSAFRFPGLGQLAYDLYDLPARWYESRWNGRYDAAQLAPGGAPFAVDCVLGAAMLVRATVAAATGGFDETFHMYCEEIDWCQRIRDAGWQVLAVPAAEVMHYGGESTGQMPASSILHLWQSRARLYDRYHQGARLALARRLARTGLRRKARRCRDVALRAAYLAAAEVWEVPPAAP